MADHPKSGSLQGTPIVYFGNDWLAENRTSSHHIATFLSKHHEVHYIECPGLRAPGGSGRDLKKIWKKLWSALRGSRAVGPNLHVSTLLQVPLHRFRLVRSLNRFLVRLFLRFHLWRSGVKRPIFWFMLPHLSQVVGRFNEQLAIYYCIDDYAALPGVDRESIASMDQELTRKADLVFVASGVLLERKRQENENAFHSPHGVDFDHFVRAQDEALELPNDVKTIARPIVGFTGLIESWIDLDLIHFLAQKRPQVSFVLIGRVAVPPHPVMDLPNVHFLGKRPYETLPAYGKAFDVAIIPYRINQQVIHANPIKLREYLAMGKPIVSVSTPEIDRYRDVVEIAHNYDEFLHQLDAVLSEPVTAESIQRRMNRVREETWERKLTGVLETVQARLARPQVENSPSNYETPASGAIRFQSNSAG